MLQEKTEAGIGLHDKFVIFFFPNASFLFSSPSAPELNHTTHPVAHRGKM